MIVHPSFLEHWKTRLLIKITNDQSAPLCVLRLWAHCQNSKRESFPDMTTTQLASICFWGDRKPACHVAMLKAGFVEKLSPKGFAAHEWSEHNRQLIQKWEAGKNGGRPRNEEIPNELPLTEKPTDNRPVTVRELDKTRPDRTGSDRLDQTDQTDVRTPSFTTAADGASAPGSVGEKVVSVGDLVGGLAGGKRELPFTPPTVKQIESYLNMQFAGAGRYAKTFFTTMTKQKWRDKEGEPINNWQAMARHYASSAALRINPDRNAGQIPPTRNIEEAARACGKLR